MTKQEWLDCKYLNQMLKQVKSKRKKQLFALACCRSIEHLMLDQRSKDCLKKLELFIDGKIDVKELKLARQKAYAATTDTSARTVGHSAAWAVKAAYYAATSVSKASYYAATADATAWACPIRAATQFELLKDIYNPSFLDIKFPQQAVSLAQQVYNGDDSARGVLSDYLEDEGYPEEIVLHLKSGFHPKGCWLIDQILEKS